MFRPDPIFTDRREAGRRLAEELTRYSDEEPLVLALPRGGVPVGFEVARALPAPLDVVFVRKIGAPGQEEVGIGAVVDGVEPHTVWNEEMVRIIRPAPDYLESEKQRQLGEIERRRRLYRGDRPARGPAGRTTIVVDDGIATGGTVRAVMQALSQAAPRRLVLAVPVAPADSLAPIRSEVDDVVCLATPEPFHAVGVHYRDFEQTSDDEVVELLRQAEETAV